MAKNQEDYRSSTNVEFAQPPENLPQNHTNSIWAADYDRYSINLDEDILSTLPALVPDNMDEQLRPREDSNLAATSSNSGPSAEGFALDISLGLHQVELDPASSVTAFRRSEILKNAARSARNRSGYFTKHCRRTNQQSALAHIPEKPYQCTRGCGSHFARKDIWDRHEQIAYPVEGWVCTIGSTVLIDGIQKCSYCPPMEHISQSSVIDCSHAQRAHLRSVRICEAIGRRDNIFTQKKHFLQHCKGVHPGIANPQQLASACLSKSRIAVFQNDVESLHATRYSQAGLSAETTLAITSSTEKLICCNGTQLKSHLHYHVRPSIVSRMIMTKIQEALVRALGLLRAVGAREAVQAINPALQRALTLRVRHLINQPREYITML